MWGRSIAALCALASLAACEEQRRDGGGTDYQRQRQAAPRQAAPAAATTAGADSPSCQDASETPDGRLRCTFTDGRRFDGQVRGGKANGQGRMWFTNGDRFEGTFA